MTEEEKQAWDGVTPEAAQYVVESVTRAAGETLLRGALHKLVNAHEVSAERHNALIYQALMAASDAGYDCGIRVYNRIDCEVEISAYVVLPNGAIGMVLAPDFGVSYIAHGEKAAETIRVFLGE